MTILYNLLREKPLRVVLLGRGSDEYTAHLKSLITENHLENKVELAGFRNPVLSYVAACDIGLLPSIVREGCSLAAQEHMSQGHPIIATNNGGQREYIKDGVNGLLVPPGDSDRLAEGMARFIDDATLRQQLGGQARADFFSTLHYDHFYRQVATFYSE